MYTILTVEDDKSLNQGIALALKAEDTQFLAAYSLKAAMMIWGQAQETEKLETDEKRQIDMILLDINLPDGSGYDFLKEVRRTSNLPVLMLTANDLELDEVMGFQLGADDYITKPFSLAVLRARVERMRQRAASSMVSAGTPAHMPINVAAGISADQRYAFDFDCMRFQIDGEEISLSKTEQKLLRMFTRHPGQTLSREMLEEAIWGNGAYYVDENALSVAVGRLRHKLEGREKSCPIRTIYGIGYVWEKE